MISYSQLATFSYLNNKDDFSHSFPSRPCTEWYWKCNFRPVVLRLLALLTATMSFMVVWSEVLFFNKSPVLSLFAIFVGVAQRSYNYFYIEVSLF